MAAACVERIDWSRVAAQLDGEGHALLPGLLGADAARQLARRIPMDGLEPERWPFGSCLPQPLQAWRTAMQPPLAAIARRWSQALGSAGSDPPAPASHASRLRAGACLALRQGAVLQVVALLSEPGVDFAGGEFVMTEQRPRMQSRVLVLPLALGDVAVIAAAARPAWGAHGCYRVQMRHAVSRVHSGERIGVELGFPVA